MTTRVRAIYVSATGQDDNLGDSVLRRGFLNSLRRPGIELNVLIGENSGSYVSGLELHETDRVFTNASQFRRACARSAIARPTVFAFNTGEMRLDDAYLKTFLGHLPLVLLTRIRGGGAIHLGFGIREAAPKWRRTIRFVLRLCRVVSWRDEDSRALMKVGGVHPDWAFIEAPHVTETDAPRDQLVVTLRGDRPVPPSEWTTMVRDTARAAGLTIAVHSQVRRDNQRAIELAAQFGTTARIWPETVSHAHWEATTAEAYNRAAIVISDRLHALIIAAREGAVPFGLAPASAEKLRRTMKPAGLDHLTCSSTSPDAVLAQSAALDAALDPTQVRVRVRSTQDGLIHFAESLWPRALV